MRVVSSQSDVDIRRKETRDALARPLRELTANLLRIARGTGKPYDLAEQLGDCVMAFSAYADAHGTLPSSLEIQQMLDYERIFLDDRPWLKERQTAALADDDTGDFELERALRIIRKGALQMVASMLLDQSLQISRGEDEIHYGMRLRNDGIAKQRKHFLKLRRLRKTPVATKPRR